MKSLIISNVILLIVVRINAGSYDALNSWYHPHTLAMVGSGSSIHIAESDRLNPSLMFSKEQLLTIGYVQYPANISSQMVQIILPRNYGTLGGTIRHISYGIFEGFDNIILEPVAKLYNKLPDPIRNGTGNFTSYTACTTFCGQSIGGGI